MLVPSRGVGHSSVWSYLEFLKGGLAQMRKTALVAILFSLGLAGGAMAQSAPSTSNTSMLTSLNGTGDSAALTIPASGPDLKGLQGVVDIVINSDAACATISAPGDWAPIISTDTGVGNLCSRIYLHTFSASDGAGTSYTFSWTGANAYTAKLLYLTNASGVDVSSGEAGYGTSWTPPPVAANAGDFLLGFYMNSSNSSWQSPADMTIAHQNTTSGYPDLITQTWQGSSGASASFEAHSGGAGQWGIGQLLAFRPANAQ
jgi:hypothetical protein